jgi:putative transcriptional regulator
MTPIDNNYPAFMLDYASGALSRAETLAAALHCALSPRGARSVRLFEAMGGRFLEDADAGEGASIPPEASFARAPERGRRDLSQFLERDLLAQKWRRSLFGVLTLDVGEPGVTLMRLDPGGRAPSHGHSRRDVTVVLQGTYADEFGVYQRGDIAFAEPGVRHQPRAVGDQPCICLIAEEPSRGWFAPRVSRSRPAR